MASIDYATLRNLTVKSDYCIGELMLSDSGKLEKINNHASKGKIGENTVVTRQDQNQEVRQAVSQCIIDKYKNKYVNFEHQQAVALANDILTENAKEILSRDEARYVVDMVEKVAKGGRFGKAECDKCKEDIQLIRRIKREGLDNLTEDQKLQAKDLIWGLRSGRRLFNGSSAIVNPSWNYRRLNQANANENPFTTPGENMTPGGYASFGEYAPTDTGTATGNPVVQNPLAGNNDLKDAITAYYDWVGGDRNVRDASGSCEKSFVRFVCATFYRDGGFKGLPNPKVLDQLKSEFSKFMSGVVAQKWLAGVTYQNLSEKMLERLRSLPGDNPIFRLCEKGLDDDLADNVCKVVMDAIRAVFTKPSDTVSVKTTTDKGGTPTEKPVEKPVEKPSENKLYTFVGILGTKFETDDKSLFDSNSANQRRHVNDLKNGMQARVKEILRDDSIRSVEDTYVAVVNYVDDPKDFLELYFPDQKLESRLFKKLSEKWFAKKPLIRRDPYVGWNFGNCYKNFKTALAKGLENALKNTTVPRENIPDKPLESEMFEGWFDQLLASLENKKVQNSLLDPDLFLAGEKPVSEQDENTKFVNMMTEAIESKFLTIFRQRCSNLIG